MENLLRSVLATLESRTEKLLETYPHYHQQIQRWKNNKMHQLMTAQSLLLHEETLAIDIFNLDKELEFLNEDNLYPELREEALTL